MKKHAFYMFITLKAAVEKCDFGGYFELIFISFIVLDIQ